MRLEILSIPQIEKQSPSQSAQPKNKNTADAPSLLDGSAEFQLPNCELTANNIML
jgi:hypothetical protein